jgi:KDO2-lipid IV(A) lauroyltransferase
MSARVENPETGVHHSAKTNPSEHAYSPGQTSPRFRDFVDYLMYLLARVLEEAVCLVPGHARSLKLGRFLGRAGFALAGERRTVTIENLTIAFGDEMNPLEIRRLARKSFENLGMMAVEFLRLRRWTQEELNKRLVLRGQRYFNQVFSPGNHGVLQFEAHVGSFEILAAAFRFLGLRGTLIATGLKNRFINRHMIYSRGGAPGLTTVPHRGSVRAMIEVMKSGGMGTALVDQRGDDNRPVWVTFFGRRVLANGIFARFAMDSGAHAIPLLGVRLDDERYLCEYGPPVPIQVSDDFQHDLEVNSQRFHDIVEGWLRRFPEQGFWMHRKFKRKSRKRRQAIGKEAES